MVRAQNEHSQGRDGVDDEIVVPQRTNRETGKMKTLMVLVALMLPFAAPALAGKGEGSISLQLGGSFPTDEFGRMFDNGWEGGLSGTAFGSDQVGVGVDGLYHR